VVSEKKQIFKDFKIPFEAYIKWFPLLWPLPIPGDYNSNKLDPTLSVSFQVNLSYSGSMVLEKIFK
jgi:hypothetical protein